MKVKDGFILRKVGNHFVVAATGDASKNFNGMIRLNEDGAYAFGFLQEGITEEKLVEVLMEKYGTEKSETEADVVQFLDKLREVEAFV